GNSLRPLAAATQTPSASIRWPGFRQTTADGGASRLRKIQLHADAVGIVEEELGVAGARHDALAEFHAFGLQALAHAVDVAGGKGDMVEAAGVLVFLRGAAHHDALARLARAHQMHGGGAAGIEPITGEIERWAIADLEPEH